MLSLLAAIPGFGVVQTLWLAVIAPFIAKIPLRVWVYIGCAIAVLMYGHYRENKGFGKCQVKYEQAADKERDRQIQVTADALAKANKRAQEAQDKLKDTQEAIDDLNAQVAKLKNAKQVCLPKSITDRYHRMH